MGFAAVDGYLLGDPVSKGDAVAELLGERSDDPAAAPFYRALDAVGVRAADEAFIALRLVLAKRTPDDDTVPARPRALGDRSGATAQNDPATVAKIRKTRCRIARRPCGRRAGYARTSRPRRLRTRTRVVKIVPILRNGTGSRPFLRLMKPRCHGSNWSLSSSCSFAPASSRALRAPLRVPRLALRSRPPSSITTRGRSTGSLRSSIIRRQEQDGRQSAGQSYDFAILPGTNVQGPSNDFAGRRQGGHARFGERQQIRERVYGANRARRFEPGHPLAGLSAPELVLDALSKTFVTQPRVAALRACSLRVNGGECVAILGSIGMWKGRRCYAR